MVFKFNSEERITRLSIQIRVITIILALFSGSHLSFSQVDTVLFYTNTGEITFEENAQSSIDVLFKNKKVILTEFIRNKHGEWKKCDRQIITKRSDTLFTYRSEMYAVNEYRPKIAHIKHVKDSIYYLKEFNSEEVLIHEGYYNLVFPKIRHGLSIDYYNNGVKRAESMYRDNTIQWSEKWLLNGEQGMNNVYSVVDEEPTYKNKDIREFGHYIMHELKLRYENTGITGTVIIEFVIMEDGSLAEIQILQSNSDILENEVINVVTATDGQWNPGRINDRKVRVIVQYPINFISMGK
jgi:hypothetical protein